MKVLTPIRSRLNFWVAFLAITLPFLFLIFHNIFDINLGEWGIILAVLVCLGLLGFLTWRGIRNKGKLPQTGLEGWLLLGLLALGISLALSKDIRMGIEQAATSIGFVVLFYLLILWFQSGLSKNGILAGAGVVSGIVTGMAGLEVYYWYWQWFQGNGMTLAMPPYPYRLVSVLGHPNFYMAFVNLMAPLVLIWMLRTRKRLIRLGAMLWMAFYLLSVPFSSSRGGWFGMVAWMGILALIGFQQSKYWLKLKDLFQRHRILTIAAGLVVTAVALFAAYKMWVVFSNNPTHATDPFGGRLELWGDALNVWKLSPWWGIGVGRYLYGYLQVTDVFPPGFWSFHAHDLFLTTLAEQGIIGLIAFMGLVIAGLLRLNEWRRQAIPEWRWQMTAMFAAIIGWLIHSLFDDFTNTLPVMVIVVIFLALLRADVRPAEDCPSRFSVNWLFAPVLAAIVLLGWLAWGNAPFDSALGEASQWRWKHAAQLAEQSTQRDPNFVYYQVEAGLIWSRAWGQTGDTAALFMARQHLSKALRLEPSLSMVWANAAVLDWYDNRPDLAIPRMQEAIRLSAYEPTYKLNLAWFFEQQGNFMDAKALYAQVLQSSPQWINHPFWQSSEFRREISAEALLQQQEKDKEHPPYWQLASQAALRGQVEEAKRMVTLSKSQTEDPMAITVNQIRIAEAEKDKEAAQKGYNDLMTLIVSNYIGDSPILAQMYARFHKRAGFDMEVVPGYLKLSQDFGQFQVLDAHFYQQLSTGNCQGAEQMLLALQKARNGGQVVSEPFLGCSYQWDGE